MFRDLVLSACVIDIEDWLMLSILLLYCWLELDVDLDTFDMG